MFNAISTFFSGIWEGISTTATNAWKGITEGLSTAWDGIKGTAETVWGAIKGNVSTITDGISTAVQDKWSNIQAAYEQHGGGLKGIAAATMEGVKGYFTLGFDALNNISGGKLSGIKTAVSTACANIKTNVTTAWNNIKTGITTTLSCVDLELQKTMYLNVTPDDGLTYNLGSNPFLQRGGGDVVARRRAVLEALLPIYYVPFRVTAIGNPAYDLGDCIRFTDGLADGSLSCITKYAFTFNQRYEMSGSGADPNQASVKSKSDKDISGLLSSVNDTAIQFYFFISVANVLVEDKRARMVIDLDYTAREGASVVFHGEIKHKITLTPEPEPEPSEGGGEGETPATPTIKIPKEAIIAVTYYVNGDEVTEYYPVDMETAGTHLLHLQYFLFCNLLLFAPVDFDALFCSDSLRFLFTALVEPLALGIFGVDGVESSFNIGFDVLLPESRALLDR